MLALVTATPEKVARSRKWNSGATTRIRIRIRIAMVMDTKVEVLGTPDMDSMKLPDLEDEVVTSKLWLCPCIPD